MSHVTHIQVIDESTPEELRRKLGLDYRIGVKRIISLFRAQALVASQ